MPKSVCLFEMYSVVGAESGWWMSGLWLQQSTLCLGYQIEAHAFLMHKWACGVVWGGMFSFLLSFLIITLFFSSTSFWLLYLFHFYSFSSSPFFCFTELTTSWVETVPNLREVFIAVIIYLGVIPGLPGMTLTFLLELAMSSLSLSLSGLPISICIQAFYGLIATV